MAIIEVKRVSKSFRKSRVLDTVSLEVKENEIFGLLGPNGAGKSTLLKILTGYYQKDHGTIKILGYNIDIDKGSVLKRIGLVPQEEQFYRNFTVKENIDFFGSLYPISRKSKGPNTWDNSISSLLEWLNLKHVENEKSKHLSGGYRRLLNIACSLVHDPEVIFFDEPTVGLDPNMRKTFWEKIKDLKKIGKTICITTHYMDEAEALCDNISLIVKGKILEVGKPRHLIRKYAGERSVRVEIKKTTPKILLDQIVKLFPDSKIAETEKSISFSIKHPFGSQKFSEFLVILAKIPQGDAYMHFHEPTLENVFFNLTGEKQEVGKIEPPKVHNKGN